MPCATSVVSTYSSRTRFVRLRCSIGVTSVTANFIDGVATVAPVLGVGGDIINNLCALLPLALMALVAGGGVGAGVPQRRRSVLP